MTDSQSTTAELLKRLETGIEDVRNSERFRDYLDTCAKFHQYSLGNQILIAMQRRDATRVAGFHTWLSLERHVMKGQKGIAILAPMTYKNTEDDEEETHLTFRRVYVFDVAQTDGKPLPEIACRLEGDDGSLYDKLAGIAREEGLTLDREAGKHSSANGYLMGKTVWIRPELSPVMSVKTFAHELAHHFAGHACAMGSRNVAETIAESVAYVVLGHFGIDTSEYSFDYVAAWSQDAKTFKSELAQISKVAKLIIERIEKGGPDTAPPVIARVEEPSSVAAPSPVSEVVPATPTMPDAQRPRFEVRKRGRLLAGKGRTARYQYTYEPYVGKGKPLPARLTNYEWHGVTAISRMAAGIASSMAVHHPKKYGALAKPASRFVSWPASARQIAEWKASESMRARQLKEAA